MDSNKNKKVKANNNKKIKLKKNPKNLMII
jgi:hypothetical protein